MTAKRALVVDDSKSARTFLSGLLEEHALEVDSAETAEQAIDYLTRHRPDVIFMDHLMPGMDGFQAVQAIKNNPRTATIPILMYTSQEGELYLGQARALGAMGVLPKKIAAADVSKVLQQLHLAEVQAPAVDEIPVVAASQVATAPVHEILVRDQIAELRRFMVTSLDQQRERILEDLRGLLPVPEVVVHRPALAPWIVATAASLTAVVMAVLLWKASVQRGEANAQLAPVGVLSTSATAVLDPRMGVVAPDAIPAVSILHVPFGEAPLGGARIGELQALVQSIAREGLKGTVEVRRHAGRYCLTGNGADGYSLADAGVAYIKCDLVADASDPVLGASTPETVEFATVLAQLRRQHGSAIRIEVTTGVESELQMPYPEIGGAPPRVPTAGEWNSAADANNRVELRWHPSS
jgi:CheY-like chemotaxis protein